jgi:2-oxoglutarate ferredoxin oxidoreductase subunit delta
MAKTRTYRLAVNAELCKGCRLCLDFCPRHVFALSEGRINARGHPFAEAKAPGACSGCLACTLVCPDAAIEVSEAGGDRP